MKFLKYTPAVALSLACTFSARAEDVSDPKVLVETTFEDCHPVAAIDGYMKETFNQTAIRKDGRLESDKVALYANAANDSYSIVITPDANTLIPKPKEPIACLLGKTHEEGYAAFTQSKHYGFFFPKR